MPRPSVVDLSVYFDETFQSKTGLTAVAGVVFTLEGALSFAHQFGPLVSRLSKPYRTAACSAARDPFGPPDWPLPRREHLMDELARITQETRVAAFVSMVTQQDFEGYLQTSPGALPFVDSPYTLCVLKVMELIGQWKHKHRPSDQLAHYWFEKGADHEVEAAAFVNRLKRAAPQLPDFALGPVDWIPKQQGLQFCGADLLAWECQRNFAIRPKDWSPRLKVFCRDKTKHFVPHRIGQVEVSHLGFMSGIFSLWED